MNTLHNIEQQKLAEHLHEPQENKVARCWCGKSLAGKPANYTKCEEHTPKRVLQRPSNV